MLDFILKILTVLGIILLILIIFLLAALLLVLFFPVTYRVRGRKNAEKTELSAGMNWLFGLLRVRYSYPEPGILTAKLLWFKLYQAKLPQDNKNEDSYRKDRAEPGRKPECTKAASEQDASEEDKGADLESGTESEPDVGSNPAIEEKTPCENIDETEQETSEQKASGQEETGSEEPHGEFLEKFQKIKYTICNIYDKIKEIWKNISYYTALLQEENTRQLFAHVKLRIAKVLKNIRPRHIRADILFGTGSPDTTGYAYGVYCMFYPVLGARFLVTPDFERAVLEGRFDISGHITVFVLGINVVRLMLDKKLRLFIRKLKKEDVEHDAPANKKALNKETLNKKASHQKKAS